MLSSPPMDRLFDDALAELLDSLDQMSVRAALLHSVLRDSEHAATGANLHAECARAVVAAKKIAHLSCPPRRSAGLTSGHVYLVRSRD